MGQLSVVEQFCCVTIRKAFNECGIVWVTCPPDGSFVCEDFTRKLSPPLSSCCWCIGLIKRATVAHSLRLL